MIVYHNYYNKDSVLVHYPFYNYENKGKIYETNYFRSFGITIFDKQVLALEPLKTLFDEPQTEEEFVKLFERVN